LIKQERDNAEAQGYRYIPHDEVARKLRLVYFTTRPDLAGNPAPAVDDELYLTDNGTRRCGATLNDHRNPVNCTVTADILTPGAHTIQLWYADTQPPDAHFFADVCGPAFYGEESKCVTYREGKTFGSGIVRNGIRIVVKEARVWVTKVDSPEPSTGCQCH
jgi:hypothetical protein